MTLLHLSLPAAHPEHVAHALARLLGGPALPFPPCPGAWIAFTAADDGTAIEVYPNDAKIEPGPETIAFATGPAESGAGPVHVAIASPLSASEVLAMGSELGWTARICSRGPFECVEL